MTALAGGTRRGTARQVFRWLGWTLALGLALGLPLLLSLSPLVPLMPLMPLMPLSLHLPPERNAFFALQGVLAPADQDPASTARQDWQRTQAWALQSPAERTRPQPATAGAALQAQAARWQPGPSGAPWVCSNQGRDCTAEWPAQTVAPARQRQAAAWGPRCDALLDAGFVWEEVVLEPLRIASPLAAIRRWMAFESTYSMAAINDVFEACLQPGDIGLQPGEDLGVLRRGFEALNRWSCKHHVGIQPQRMRQAMDARWLQRLALHLRAAQLALDMQGQGVPAAERAAWLARQPLALHERERLQLQDDGLTLVARGWTESAGGPLHIPARDATRITWPR